MSRSGVAVVCLFQAEDGIRDLVRSRGLGDVYKRQQQQVEQNEPQKSKMQKLQEGPGSIPVRFTNSLQELSLIHI